MQKKIHIIGAGISGLIAAIQLEKSGFTPTIIEATSTVGGRVKSDIVEGFVLDHGFQVLLNAYPKAQHYLDYKALNLQALTPGAVIFNKGKKQIIGDPLRQISLLIPTLFSNIGSFRDKILIFKLNQTLKNKSIEAIFNETATTSTLDYLKDKGFSDRMINQFFKPFFTGIFIETALDTPSQMFEFIYKMFGEGLAVIPKDGIQAIPNQLKSQLKQSTFLFDTKVKKVEEKCIILEDDSRIETDVTVIATESTALLQNAKPLDWKSCDTLYFTVENDSLKQPIIGLVTDEEALINNIFFNTGIENNATNSNHLLVVSIIKKHLLNEEALIKQVTEELYTFCGISVKAFVKRYVIKKALPQLAQVKHTSPIKNYRYSDSIYLAGDHTLNGSLNAAMTSGEEVANIIINS